MNVTSEQDYGQRYREGEFAWVSFLSFPESLKSSKVIVKSSFGG